MEEGKKKEGGGKGSGAFFYYAALAALPTEFHEAEEASRIGAGGGKGGEGRGGGDVSGFLEPRSNREGREASHLRRGGMGKRREKRMARRRLLLINAREFVGGIAPSFNV